VEHNYPNKPKLDSDALIARRFRISEPGVDSSGGVLADVFSHLHVLGIILLFGIGGLAYGWIAIFLRRRYGLLGEILFIGMLANLIPFGDAFAGYFAQIRNIILVPAITMLVFQRGKRKRQPRAPAHDF